MKIYAFDVTQDELSTFHEIASKNDIEIELHAEGLTAQNIPLLEPNSAVTTLSIDSYGKKEFDLLQAQGIKYFSTRTIGYNHLDIATAKENGIHVCHSDYPPNGVADYAIMMMLLCLRKYKQALWRSQINDYSLKGMQGREIKDLTIGVMGTGRIGKTFIKDLSGFGCKILAYDKFENEEVKQYATYVDADTIYRESDVISLHMPLLPETFHIINEESISKMKKGVIIINCARGALMDLDSLIRNIENEHIGALGLDCLEKEEDIVHKDRSLDIVCNREMAYLRQFQNVIHTPHMAFYTDSAVKGMVETSVYGLINMMQGKPWHTQIV